MNNNISAPNRRDFIVGTGAALTSGGAVYALTNSTPSGTQAVVTDYGAKPDWNSDSTSGSDNKLAFEKASYHNSIVLVPKGDYYLSQMPAFPAGCTLRGSGDDSVLHISSSAVTNPLNRSRNNNVSVENLKVVVHGNNENTTLSTLFFKGGYGHQVRDVTVIGGKIGIQFHNAPRSTVINCRVSDQVGTPIPQGIYISGDNTMPSECRVQGNTISNVKGCGIMLNTTDVKKDSLVNLMIIGNNVANVTDNGIRVQTSGNHIQKGFFITDNTVELPSDGSVNCIRINGDSGICADNVLSGGNCRDKGLRRRSMVCSIKLADHPK